jgi:hypothetical protein
MHEPVIERKTFAGLLFANGLAITSFIIVGLEKAIDQVVQYLNIET